MTLEPTDPFDIVRRLYRAINESDLATIERLHAEDAVAEQVFDGTFVVEGRAAIVEAYRAERAAGRGAFEGGARLQARTIGGIETGWGWVQADWIECIKGDGSPVFSGAPRVSEPGGVQGAPRS